MKHKITKVTKIEDYLEQAKLKRLGIDQEYIKKMITAAAGVIITGFSIDMLLELPTNDLIDMIRNIIVISPALASLGMTAHYSSTQKNEIEEYRELEKLYYSTLIENNISAADLYEQAMINRSKGEIIKANIQLKYAKAIENKELESVRRIR